MDSEFGTNPRCPLHAVIGIWDVTRDTKGWHVDIAVYETTSLSSIKAWLILRCTDLMYVGVRRVVLRSKAFPKELLRPQCVRKVSREPNEVENAA